MAGGDVRDLSIGLTWKVNVDPLKKADEATNQLIHTAEELENRMKINPAGIAKGTAEVKNMSDVIGFATGKFKGLVTEGKNAGAGISVGFGKADSAINKTSGGVDKLRSKLRDSGSYGKTIGDGVVSGANKANEAINREMTAIEKLKSAFNGLKSAQATAFSVSGGGGIGSFNKQLDTTEKKVSKIKESLKETTAAFSVGMLGAQLVLSAGEKVKEAFGSGYEYNKQQSGMQGTWKTLVAGSVDEGISKKQAGNSKDLVSAINDQSMRYGRSLDLTDEAYQQMYHATESASKTKHMVQSELRIADAMNLTDDQASHFTMYGVGHALDRGTVNGQSLNQMSQYAPAITGALARAYLSSTGHKKMTDISTEEVDEEKKKLREDIKNGEVNAEMLSKAVNYLGDVKFKNAAKNAMSTLPGMTRAIENGIPRMMGAFEKAFAKPIEKTMGKNLLGLSEWFTSGDAQKAAKKLGNELGFLTTDISQAAGKVAPYAKAFGTGFIDGIKGTFNTVKELVADAKNIGKDILSIFPKGSGNQLSEYLKQGAKVAGVITAVGVSFKAFTKLPAIGKPLQSILNFVGKITKLDKIPGIKSLFAGVKGKDAALNANTGALNRLTAALGGKGGAGLANDAMDNGGRGSRGARLTRGNRKLNRVASKYERAIERYGVESAQALKAGAKFNKLSAINAAKIPQIGAKQGLHSIAYQSEVTQAKGIAQRVEKTKYDATRAAEEQNWSRVTKNAGNYGKVATKFGGAISKIGKATKFLGKGMPVLNGIFGAFDVANAITSTKSGTKARHKAVGGAIGSTGGSIVGAAAGSLLDPFIGPLGTIGGGIAGGFFGQKFGEWFGGKTGGTTKPKQTKAQKNAVAVAKAQNAADEVIAKESFADQMKAYGYDKKNSNELYKQIQKGTSSKSTKKQVTARHMEQALEAGDVAAMLKYQAQLNKQNGIKPGEENADSRPKKKPFIGPKPVKQKKPTIGPKKVKNNNATSPFANIRNAKKETKETQSVLSKAEKKAKKVKLSPKSDKKGYDHVKKDAQKGSKDVTNTVKKGAKDVQKAGKNALNIKSDKKGMKNLNRDAQKGMKNTSKTVKKGAKDVQKSAKDIFKFKTQKSAFNKLNKTAKSGINKVKKTIKKGSKDVQKSGKNIFKFKTSKSGFNKLTKTAQSGIKKVEKTIKSGVKKTQKAGKNVFKFKTSKSGFNKLTKTAKSGMNKVTKTVKSGSKKVQNSGKNIFKFKSSKSGFNQLNSTAKSGMNRVNSTVKSGANKVKNTVKTGFKFKGAASGFNQLNSAAKSGMNRVDNTIKSSANKWQSSIKSALSKAASTMTSQFSKMASTAQSKASAISTALSKIGTTASNVAGKVNTLQSAINGLKSKTVTLTVNVAGKGAKKAGFATGTPGARQAFKSYKAYANGTPGGGHTGGMALVNDAKGPNYREAFMLPNGLVGLFPDKRNLEVPLPVGTHVLDAESTKKKFRSHYAKGTTGAQEAFKKLNATGGSAPVEKSNGKQTTIVSINPNMSFTFNGGVDANALQKMVLDLFNANMKAMANQVAGMTGLSLA